MDFIKQLKGFARKRLTNPISANGIALYITLFEYCNDLRFPNQFTAPNSILQGKAGLSPKALQRARNELIQKGFIGYKNGSGNQCGTYELVELGDEKEFDSSFCPANVSQTVPQMSHKCPTNVPQMSHKVSTLNNLTITELNSELNSFDNNNNKNALAQVIQFYKDNMGTDVTPLIAEAMDDWLDSVDGSLILYAVSEAVTANVKNWKYANSIIQNHFSAGRKTWAEAEEAAYQRKHKDEPQETWEDDMDSILLGGANKGLPQST